MIGNAGFLMVAGVVAGTAARAKQSDMEALYAGYGIRLGQSLFPRNAE